MDNKNIVLFLISIFIFNAHVCLGMQLTPAIQCTIEQVYEQNAPQEKPVLVFTNCIGCESCIIFKTQDNGNSIHYLFTLSDAKQLLAVQENEVLCSIDNGTSSSLVKIILNDSIKQTIKASSANQTKKYWKNHIKYITTDIYNTNNTYTLSYESPIDFVVQQTDLSKNASSQLEQLVHQVNLDNSSNSIEIAFTLQAPNTEAPCPMKFILDNSSILKFPRDPKNIPIPPVQNNPVPQTKEIDLQVEKFKSEHIEPIITLLDNMVSQDKNSEAYKKNSHDLQALIIDTVTRLNPHFFEQIKVEENQSIELLSLCQQGNQKLQDFHKSLQLGIHPDKNQNRRSILVGAIDELQPALHLYTMIAKVNKQEKEQHDQKIFQEAQNFTLACFQQHAFPAAIHILGTLGTGLGFYLSKKSQTIANQNISILQEDSQKTKFDTEDILLSMQHKLNQHNKKQPTMENITRLSKSLERYI